MEGKGISAMSACAAHLEDDLPADRPARAALGPGSMQTDSTRARATRAGERAPLKVESSGF